ncbi:MAG: short-chain dehydrogenase/reductase [Pseudonocardiales bacterium]|nr:short-chain dehydrogenase/reductase [Pseudonocardiales bacterium]
MADGRFDDQVLLVTGGGSGIGAATARTFTERGGRVAIVDYRIDAAREVADSLEGGCAFAADVSDEESVKAAIAAVDKEFGRVDCVLNAAGHAVSGPLESWSYSEWTRMMAVHAGGTFLICREVLPILRRGGGGAIVNVASIAALAAQPNNSPYGAAKGAIMTFSRQLAIELAPHIRVNVIAPGRVRTPMTEPLVLARGGGDLEKGLAVTAGLIPLGRMIEPGEMADSICFLLSNQAVAINGIMLTVDGGETAI